MKHCVHTWFFCLAAWCCLSLAQAQQRTFVQFVATDTTFAELEDLLESQTRLLPNRTPIDDPAREVLASLLKRGYLEASIDSSVLRQDTVARQDTVTNYVHVGQRWQWAKLDANPQDADILSRVRYREKLYTGQPLSPIRVQQLTESILTYLENHGYPFAAVHLDSLQTNGTTLEADLRIEKHDFVRIDSISVLGSSKLSPYYLMNYIGIKPGDPYSEKRIRNIDTRLNELPFLTQARPAEVLFTADQTTLILVVDRKKANNFNGVLGFQPDDETGEIVLTGDVRLLLQNPLNLGETVELNWRRLQTQTQDLKLKAVFPYLFRTPFGVEGMLQLYRRDTTFSTVTQNLGANYYFTGTDYFQVFVNRDRSSLISTIPFQSATSLPENADVEFISYGIGYNFQRLDYRFNPRKGIRLNAKGSTGEKEILRNPNLPNVDYDALDLTTVQYRGTLDVDGFIPLFRRATLNLGLQAALLDNDNLFFNELYRIGGLNTLRGFDEESIFASTYAISTVEFRWLLERNSYVHLFFDGAYYEREIVTESVSDLPFGFGAGITFETGAGIFSLNYALGRQFENPVELRTSKVHFGFVNFF